MVYNTQYIDGKYYHFDSNGLLQYGVFVNEDDNIYYYGRASGTRQYGWINYYDKIYYFDLSSGKMVTGVKIIDGLEYLFNSDGILASGWQTINGRTYYFNRNGERIKGFKKITGNRYYFDSNGVLLYSNFKIFIDISSWQGDIDFNRLWYSGAIDGVILRIGYWTSEDKYFKYYIQEVKRLGIPYTVYLFSYAHNGSESLQEAQNMLNLFTKYQLNPAMNVYYDVEGYRTSYENSDDITPEQYQSIVETFINYMNQHGIGARIYSYYWFALNRFNDQTRSYLDWIAKYSDNNNYPYNWRGWQFTSTGSVPGINGNVDMNIFLY